MSNSNDSIDAELATLDKLLELSMNTTGETSTSSLKTPVDNNHLASKRTKKRKLPETERSFTTEMDEAFAEFNQTVTEIYRKYNMTSQAAWNASKRIMIMRQKLDTTNGKDKLL